ncbi:MAG: SDR family NAD(P)-dependent oxidoreductase [Gemmobacter sp.]|uniref:SDR family NAD(P)-dependent oxidoreductase n=1 Tax=Gemmobacter sp. TaxID=1898957 RepID=UPI00391A37FC
MQMSSAKAIITGAASGLGAATARGFREAGAQVTIFDRDAERGQALAAEIGATYVTVDVTDEASVAAGVAAAKAAMGGVNVLVNCAGIAIGEKTVGKEGPHDLARYRKVIDVNLVGTFNCIRLAAAEMAGNDLVDGERGAIVNTASIAAFDGQKGQAAYAASKAGVAGMTLPIARDLAQNAIRINTIAPGLFLTPMLMGLPEDARTQLAADVPFPRRLGDPAEYARLVRFMVECGYLNGETIRIDGALRMR